MLIVVYGKMKWSEGHSELSVGSKEKRLMVDTNVSTKNHPPQRHQPRSETSSNTGGASDLK